LCTVVDEKVAQEMGRATEVPLLLFNSEEEVFCWPAALFLACHGEEASALCPTVSRVVFVFIVCWGLVLRSDALLAHELGWAEFSNAGLVRTFSLFLFLLWWQCGGCEEW
jgi:hypothetical protein